VSGVVSGLVVRLVRRVPLVWMVLLVPAALLVIVALRDRPARKAKRAEMALLERLASEARWDQVDRLALLDPRVRVARLANAGQSAPRAIRDQPVRLDPLAWPARQGSHRNR
jgi:hypothetical protein